MDNEGLLYVKERMPSIGLGTYQIKDSKVIFQIVDKALETGYRMFDTAQVYANEIFIGDALQQLLPKYNLKREDIFIITKLKPSNQGESKAKQSIYQSLQNLHTDYIDLFLIHWPGVSSRNVSDPSNAKLRSQSWAVMEEMYRSKELRAIGVSNYEIRHLEILLSSATVQVALNQCEYHPHYEQKQLIDYCTQHNIVFQAYSSFGSPRSIDKLVQDEQIQKMASKYNCSITQFLLAWSISQGISVLPRSTNVNHIADNYKSIQYKISEEDIDAVMSNKRRKYCWDPSVVS